MTRALETPANFLRPLTMEENWSDIAFLVAWSSSYLGSVFPSKQVVAQEPVTEGAEDVEEAITISRQGDEADLKDVQKFELLPNWYRKDARQIKGGLFSEFKPELQVNKLILES